MNDSVSLEKLLIYVRPSVYAEGGRKMYSPINTSSQRKESRMAKKPAVKKPKWRTLTDQVKSGPGVRDLIKAITRLLEGGLDYPIPIFGGYRKYPIRITGISINNDGSLDIEGILDYRDFSQGAGLSGSKARVKRYYTHNRIGRCIEAFQ